MTALAITYALQLMGRLQLTVRTSIELENNMTGLERIHALQAHPRPHPHPHLTPRFPMEAIPQEGTRGSPPGVEWPAQGQVEFVDVHLRYRPGLPEVPAPNPPCTPLQPPSVAPRFSGGLVFRSRGAPRWGSVGGLGPGSRR